jgi:ABC-2 type transport system permease protein
MKKILLVAKWEFFGTVTRRGYIIAVVAMPVVFGLFMGLAVIAGRSAPRAVADRPVALVDSAHMLDRTAIAAPLIEYPTVGGALDALRSRVVSTVFVIESNYMTTGRITSYGIDTGLFAIPNDRRRQDALAQTIRTSLIAPALTGDPLARATAPTARVLRLHIDDQGGVTPDADGVAAIGPFAGSFGVFLIFTMAIFFSAGFLLQATIEDRQNRMMEILLSSLDIEELLVGKILGLGAAGLLQVVIYLGLIVVPGMTFLAIFQVPVARLGLSLVYFALGYTLFACLMTATGALGRSAQESTQLSTIWTMTAISPMFFLAPIAVTPNGLLARGLSFFPLTAPVTMILRLSTGDVPPLDIILSIAIGVAAIYLSLRAASRVLRAASLMYGKRPTLPELLHWLRAT